MARCSWETYSDITWIMHEYHRCFNAGLWDELGALFGDASYETQYPWNAEGHGVQRGPEQVAADFRDMVRLYDGKPRVQYSLSNVMLEADEDAGRATCRSQYIGLFGARPTWDGYIGVDPREGGERLFQFVSVGRYHDTFVRDENGWRFASRTCLPDFTGDRSVHLNQDPVEYGRQFAQQQARNNG